MPVSTVSADQIVWKNGRPTIADKSKSTTAKSKQKVLTSKPPNSRRSKPYFCRAEQLTPLLDLVTPGCPVAVDCEGLLLPKNEGWRKTGLGRVSIVNMRGQVIYDTFVYYPSDVEHRPPPQYLGLGVKYKDIRPENGAQSHAKVLTAVKSIFDKSGIVIAHAAHNDIQMLDGIDFDPYVVRDTQCMTGFPHNGRRRGLPGLAALAHEVLGRNIQFGEHSSVEDAQATMDLFLWHYKRHGLGLDYAGKPLRRDSPGSDDGASGTVTAASPPSPIGSERPVHLELLPDGQMLDTRTGEIAF